MIDNVNTAAIISAGMFHLKDKLGVLDTETFIAAIRNEHFDYTKWRRDNLCAGMSLREINDAAAEFGAAHPRPPLRHEGLTRPPYAAQKGPLSAVPPTKKSP